MGNADRIRPRATVTVQRASRPRRRELRLLVLAAFAVFELAVAVLAPVADALDHARDAARPTNGVPQPGAPEHDPLACAICQHVERSRSIVAHAPVLVLTSPDNPFEPSSEVVTPFVPVHTDRPHGRDPPNT